CGCRSAFFPAWDSLAGGPTYTTKKSWGGEPPRPRYGSRPLSGSVFGEGRFVFASPPPASPPVFSCCFETGHFLPPNHDGVLTQITEQLKEHELRSQLARANYHVISSELIFVEHRQSELRVHVRWIKPARDTSPPAFLDELARSPSVRRLHWEPQ